MPRTIDSYAFRVELDAPFEQALEMAKAALAEQSFGIISEIDMQAKFKEKLGVDFGRYTILGACNPALAHEALTIEPQVGLLLPCNVIVRAADGGDGSVVSVMDPMGLMGDLGEKRLEYVAAAAHASLRAVAADLEGSR
jgi:uncharacterized protein (DUF302 family)